MAMSIMRGLHFDLQKESHIAAFTRCASFRDDYACRGGVSRLTDMKTLDIPMQNQLHELSIDN